MIQTPNLQLLLCTPEILHATIESDAALGTLLQLEIPEKWSEFGTDIFGFVLERLQEAPEEVAWWAYFPVYDGTIVGTCGYKGAPNAEGAVEIGYEVAPDYRNRGFATEMAAALVQNALQHQDVKTVYAHTLAHENPSTHVLKKCGFEKIGELIDPDDGAVWKWKYFGQ